MYEAQKIHFFRELVSCSYNLYFFEYDTSLTLLDSNCANPKLIDGFFTLSKSKDLLRNYIQTSHKPVILSDPMGLMWAANFETQNDKPVKIHIMGPAFINQVSIKHIEEALNTHNMSVALKKQTLREFEQIPLITSTAFYQYALMFHYCLHREKIVFSDLEHLTTTKFNAVQHNVSAEKTSQHTGVSNTERMLLQAVEQGNLNYKILLQKAGDFSSGVKANLGNAIQQAKYSSVTFVALCSRAAIRGGISAPVAYSLNDRYVELIDGCKTLGELVEINNSIMQDFTQRVHNCKQSPKISVPIQTCCDYISMNITQKLNIEDISKQVGYSNYYLTRKFKQEMGIPINQFIRSKRIEHAKILLTTTNINIQEISAQLHFGSRSYFASTFLSEVGMSPSEYREKHRSF